MKNLVVKIFYSVITTWLLTTSIAQAQGTLTWNWNFSVNGFNGSGMFTTEDTTSTANGYTGYLITALTGTLNGNAVTLLAPGQQFVNSPSDNIVGNSAPQLSSGGFAFTTTAGTFQILSSYPYFSADSYQIDYASGAIGGGTFIATNVSPTPEPGTLILSSLGALSLLGLRYRK